MTTIALIPATIDDRFDELPDELLDDDQADDEQSNGQEPPHYPLVRLDFHTTGIIMSQYDTESGGLVTYPVSTSDVAAACGGFPTASDLLPRDTLFWGRQGPQTKLGIYIPARRWPVLLTHGQSYHIPLPPFVFVGLGNVYYVYAVKQRPQSNRTHLYHFPSPNIYSNGRICPGNTPFPDCATTTIQTALALFLTDSRFSSHLASGRCHGHPQDVRELWQALDGKRRFPKDQLIPMNHYLSALI